MSDFKFQKSRNKVKRKVRSDFLVYCLKKIECSDQRAKVVVELVGVPRLRRNKTFPQTYDFSDIHLFKSKHVEIGKSRLSMKSASDAVIPVDRCQILHRLSKAS